jgi:putative transcriptional regulator
MDVKNTLTEKIAGEITLSPKPGQTIRKWREIFNISQTELAQYLDLSPSVICDYESGRRKSPGIQIVKKFVGAFLEIDEKKNNAETLRRYQPFARKEEGILEIMEYPYGIPIKEFIKEIEGGLLTSPNKADLRKEVNGFTLVDSVKTITTLSSANYAHLYGWSTDRAMVFTGVKYGRSPMIAIRIHPVKPAVVVYHKPNDVDPLAKNLSEQEKIPLVVTNLSLNNLNKKLISLRVE